MNSLLSMLNALEEIAYIEKKESGEILFINNKLLHTIGVNSLKEYQNIQCFDHVTSKITKDPKQGDQDMQASNFVVWSQKVNLLDQTYSCLALPYTYEDFSVYIVIAVHQNRLESNDLIEYKDNLEETSKKLTCDNNEEMELETQNQYQDSSALDYYLSNAYHDMRFFIKAIIKNNSVGFYFFGDMQKNIFYISDNLRDCFGFSGNIVENFLDRWSDRIATDSYRIRFRNEIDLMMKQKRCHHNLRYQIFDNEGRRIWVRGTGSLKWDTETGKPLFMAGKISKQDNDFVIDPVTNFPVASILQCSLIETTNESYEFLSVGFSLDNIALINATKGRAVGDRIIKRISNQLVDSMAAEMNFLRLPGTKCMGIISHSCSASVEDIITKIKTIIKDTYEAEDIPAQGVCSFAILQWPHKGLNAENFVDCMVALVKKAQKAKSESYLDARLIDLNMIHLQSQIEMKINEDVYSGMHHFRTVVQPIVSSDTGKIIGGEALMRWTYKGDNVSPAIFVPLLENKNLIVLAGRWIFEQSIQICKKILPSNPDFRLDVNISIPQLNDEGFLDFMAHCLEKYELDGNHIILELTESFMDQEPDKLMKLVAFAKQYKMEIALDDFGSGYSSMRVLLRYPSSIIKLDRSLLIEMMDSTDKKTFISSIVYACHSFSKKVCIEGVEDEAQNSIAKESGCDMIQGFYYHRPMELDELYVLLG